MRVQRFDPHASALKGSAGAPRSSGKERPLKLRPVREHDSAAAAATSCRHLLNPVLLSADREPVLVQRFDPRAFALKGSAGAPRSSGKERPLKLRPVRERDPAAAAAATAGHMLPLSQPGFALEGASQRAPWDASSNGDMSYATQVSRYCVCACNQAHEHSLALLWRVSQRAPWDTSSYGDMLYATQVSRPVLHLHM